MVGQLLRNDEFIKIIIEGEIEEIEKEVDRE